MDELVGSYNEAGYDDYGGSTADRMSEGGSYAQRAAAGLQSIPPGVWWFLGLVALLSVLGAFTGIPALVMSSITTADGSGTGPRGRPGNTGPPGPDGPPGTPGIVNATNGILYDSLTQTIGLGGTLIRTTTIDQQGYPFTMTSLNTTLMSGLNVVPGTFGAGGKAEMISNGVWYKSVAMAATQDIGAGYYPFGGVATVRSDLTEVHAVVAQPDASIMVSITPTGAGQVVLSQGGFAVFLQEGSVQIAVDIGNIDMKTGNGELYIRNLDEDVSATADQVLVRNSGSEQVMWSSFTSFIGADNGLHMTGSDVYLGGTLVENTLIDQGLFTYTHVYDGFTTVVVADSLTLSPSNGELFVGNLDQDTLIEADEILVRSHLTDQVFWQERTPVTVYVDNADPNAASVFSLDNPPTVDDPALHDNVRYYYVGTDGSLWTYDGAVYNLYLGFVASDRTAGSSSLMYSSATQAIDNLITPHTFDLTMINWGPSVFISSTDSVILRARGIYEITAEEYINSVGVTDDASIGIFADGVLVGGSEGYMSSVAGTYSSKPAHAIVRVGLTEVVITVLTTSFTGTPSIGPNSALTIKQIYWF